jgi:pimeloyl-ACP methyl ester carboxylesterase
MPSIYHRELGSGPPVILLHGFCETHTIWEGMLLALSDRYRVFAPDLPGFGRSELLPSGFSLDDVADHVANFLESVGVKGGCVIGHSLGGYVTLALTERHPHLVKSFGLFHSTALPDTPEKQENRNRVSAFVQQNGVPTYIQSFIPSLFAQSSHPDVKPVVEEAIQTPLITFLEYTRAMRDRPDRMPLIRAFNGPILFIAGGKDSVIPVEKIQQQATEGKHPHVVVFHEAGHMGMLENPAESQAVLSDFLAITGNY